MTDTLLFAGFTTPEVHRQPYQETSVDEMKKAVRYTLDSISGNIRTVFDRVEKRFFGIRGERAWKKWEKENHGNWACDF